MDPAPNPLGLGVSIGYHERATTMELVLLLWLVCGVIGAVLAQSKNRSALTGGLVGVLAGPVGVFIVALQRKLEPGEVERTGLSKPVRYFAIGAGVFVALILVLAFAIG